MSSDSERADRVRLLGLSVLCAILVAVLSGTGLVLFRLPVLNGPNLYWPFAANPITYVDPDGQLALPLAGCFAGAVIGVDTAIIG